MANTVTLSELKTTIKDQADMTGSSFIDDTQLTYWINSSLSELHELLIDSFQDYFVSFYEFDLDGSDSYLLPRDFFKVIKVYIVDGDARYALRRFMLDELDDRRYGAWPQVYTDQLSSFYWSRYRILGNEIIFSPLPDDTVSDTIELWYVPQFQKLEYPDDQVNYAVPVYWEDFVIWDVVARALQKEESDPSVALQRKEFMRQRILRHAAQRDLGESPRVHDVTGKYNG